LLCCRQDFILLQPRLRPTVRVAGMVSTETLDGYFEDLPVESRVSCVEEVMGLSWPMNQKSRKDSGLKIGLGVPRQ